MVNYGDRYRFIRRNTHPLQAYGEPIYRRGEDYAGNPYDQPVYKGPSGDPDCGCISEIELDTAAMGDIMYTRCAFESRFGLRDRQDDRLREGMRRQSTYFR